MPTLELIPISAVLHLQAGDSVAGITRRSKKKILDESVYAPTFTESLTYSVIPRGLANYVRLTSGEEFSKLEGNVTLQRSAAENTDEAVGLLFYLSEAGQESSYNVVCKLPVQQFDELVSAARQGRMPNSISVYVVEKSAETSRESDDSDFIWDNKEFPSIPVAAISFGLPLVLPTDPDENDEDGEAVADK